MTPKPFELTFDQNPTEKYPHGYWYAYSPTTDAEGEGPDPLTTLAVLAAEMERKWAERTP